MNSRTPPVIHCEKKRVGLRTCLVLKIFNINTPFYKSNNNYSTIPCTESSRRCHPKDCGLRVNPLVEVDPCVSYPVSARWCSPIPEMTHRVLSSSVFDVRIGFLPALLGVSKLRGRIRVVGLFSEEDRVPPYLLLNLLLVYTRPLPAERYTFL